MYRQATLCLVWMFIAGVASTTLAGEDVEQSELAKLAAAMEPGAWAELNTEGYGPDLLDVQNHHILEYTDTAVWNPKSQQVLFVGQGHYSALRFIAYSAATNPWKRLPTPKVVEGRPGNRQGGPIGHAYNNNALDAARGILFHHQSATRLVHRYDVAADKWTTLPEIKDAAAGHGTALAWFPERQELVRILGGTVHVFDERTNAWSILKDKLPVGPYHNLLSRTSPVDGSVIRRAGT